MFIHATKSHFKTAEPSFQDARGASFQARKRISCFARAKLKKGNKPMTNNALIDLSMDFAVSVVNLCDNLKGRSVLTNQLLRSGTSIGANIHEANYAQTTPDFIAKLQIALKECHETEYWLKLFSRTTIIDADTYKSLSNISGKIRRMLIASLNTIKNKQEDASK